jgi:molybdenum cofactor biosynthesis protein B
MNVVDLLASAGHQLLTRHIVPDEPKPIRRLLAERTNRAEVDAILLTGGTGLGRRDQTFETVSRLLTKPPPG